MKWRENKSNLQGGLNGTSFQLLPSPQKKPHHSYCFHSFSLGMSSVMVQAEYSILSCISKLQYEKIITTNYKVSKSPAFTYQKK